MHQIKGFYSVASQVNNASDSVALFGELSSTSRTYARDVKEYTSSQIADVKFTLFYSKKDQQNQDLELTTTELILRVGQWLYSLGDTISINTTSSQLANTALNNFMSVIQDVQCGEIQYDGNKRLPTWISFQLRQSTSETHIKVWLSDDAFSKEYDHYEIDIIPPFENIDQFFMPVNDLKTLVAKIDPVEVTDRINEARGLYPYTYLRAENTIYVNPSNHLETLNIHWWAIIYGRAGDDSEIIRQAIVTYINEHSRSSETEWKVILPDLFNVTAFYILPRWDKQAIAHRKTIPGIYSPISAYKEVFEYTKDKLGAIVDDTHLENNLETTVHRFKSITLATVGGMENRRSLYKLSDYYSDYIAEESTHEDFNRQKETTKKWTNMITELLIKAENFSSNSVLPAHIRLVTRNNHEYLVRKFNNIEYYLMLKRSVVAE